MQPLTALEDVREVHEPRRLVERVDLHGLRVEDLPDLVADGVVDRLVVELACDGVLHAVDQRQLRVPLPRLVHQPRVLERHAEAAGQRLQQLLVGLAEGVLAIDVLERDHAGRLAATTSGTNRTDFGASPAENRGCRTARPRLSRFSSISSGSRVSSTCFVKPAGKLRLGLQPLAALDDVREVHEPRRLVERRDRDDLRVEDLLDPVADGVVDRLRVELARDRVLHAVDQRQLGVPLPRLVHEPRVLERHAEAAGQRRQQADVVLGERVRPVEVLRARSARELRRRR